ncbi:MFS transporter [Pseudolabrys sp. FHR47]|uniref:MFS transporter n=1 Tax=Pseudolabrys sp. FHR47 TaxID=2562284 RepID=UPI001FEEAC82|nr:MFS transporter [Pseudolabrys sp. FHR47]
MSNTSDRSPGSTAPGTPRHPGFLAIFPSIMLPMFLAVVDQTIIATALPAIAAATGEVERVSWIVVSYLIAATIAAPVYGRLGDSFGRRRVMYFALGIFLVASVLCAASTTILALTAARVLQGLGGGGLMTLSQALVGESIPPRERARYQGYLAAVAVCANSFGPIAGGILTEHFGWQSIFLVNLPIGLFALYLVTRLPPPHGERLAWRADPGGVVLFAIFVATTLLALEQVQRADLANLPIGGALLAAGLVALTILIWHENRAASPLIPLSLLRQSAIWHSDALAACHGAALVSLITFIPVYLEVVRGFSPSATGVVLVPLTIGIGIGSLVTGRLVNASGRLTIYPVVGLSIATLDFVVLALLADNFGIAALAALLLVNGLAMGTVMGVVQVSVQNAAGQQRLGEAAASVQFSRSIGAAFGTALVATVLFAVLSMRSPDAARVFAAMFEHADHAGAGLSAAQMTVIQGDIKVAFRAAFLVMALFTMTGFFLSLTNPQKRI